MHRVPGKEMGGDILISQCRISPDAKLWPTKGCSPTSARDKQKCIWLVYQK